MQTENDPNECRVRKPEEVTVSGSYLWLPHFILEQGGIDPKTQWTAVNSLSFEYYKELQKGKHDMTTLHPKNGLYYGPIEEVEKVVNRLKNIQIENSDWRDILRLHDTPTTLFYLDPPYLPETRNKGSLKTYGNGEMSYDDHIELLESLKKISGKFAISGYRSKLYDEKLSNCYCYEAAAKKTSAANGKRTSRIEVLWTNYNPNDGQMELF